MMRFLDFIQEFRSDLVAGFPEILKLIQLGALIPMTSVPCEVDFSRLNLLKSNRRTRLRTFVLSCLMRISLVPLSVAEFKKTCCARAVKHFMDMCTRRGVLTTNTELTEYIAECALEEPCQEENDEVA